MSNRPTRVGFPCLEHVPYTFSSRFEGAAGASPEELLGWRACTGVCVARHWATLEVFRFLTPRWCGQELCKGCGEQHVVDAEAWIELDRFPCRADGFFVTPAPKMSHRYTVVGEIAQQVEGT